MDCGDYRIGGGVDRSVCLGVELAGSLLRKLRQDVSHPLDCAHRSRLPRLGRIPQAHEHIHRAGTVRTSSAIDIDLVTQTGETCVAALGDESGQDLRDVEAASRAPAISATGSRGRRQSGAPHSRPIRAVSCRDARSWQSLARRRQLMPGRCQPRDSSRRSL
jgi:hypothetical protein